MTRRPSSIVARLLGLAPLLCVSAFPAPAAVLYVRSSAPGAEHDGKTWATAFQSLQPALDAASPGDEVWVAGGIYVENINLTAGVGLYGGFAGTETARDQRDWKANPTVLDGNQQGNVVTVPVDAPRSTVLDGFTVQHGNGNITPVTFPALYGSGLFVGNASPTISHNIFRDNNGRNEFGASSGGGAYIYGGAPSFAGNQFLNNAGSGIEAYQATIELRDNLAAGNRYGFTFGSCVLTVVNNTIEANSDDGIHQPASSTGWIANNLIVSNGYGINDSAGPALSHNCAYGNRYYDFLYSDSDGLAGGNVRANPRLRNDGLHLRPDSPCVNAGGDSATQAGETDIDGQPRIQGEHVDIGADEFDFSYTIPPPPPVAHVRPDGNDDNDGATWETAKRTIAGAVLDLAAVGGEVWAAAGTYTGRIDLTTNLSLYGGFAGTEVFRDQSNPSTNPTVLQKSAVSVNAGATNVIDGLSFQQTDVSSQAASLTVSRCAFETGGISQTGGTLVVTDSTFHKGTMAVSALGTSVTIERNTISGYCPSANLFGTISARFGAGALTLRGCTGEVSGNVVSGNCVMGYNAESLSGGGAGLYAGYCTLFVSRNVITQNSSAMFGNDDSFPIGGGVLGEGGFLVLSDNLIAGNDLSGSGLNTGGAGSGVFLDGGSALLVNNTIVGNTVHLQGPRQSIQGGGVYVVASSNPTDIYRAENNIVAFNDTGVDWYGPAPEWSHNDVFGNGQDYPTDAPNPTGTDGNLSADPLFVNRAAGDYHLQPLSSCIDAGDDLAVRDAYDLDSTFRIQGLRVDMGAYETLIGGAYTMGDAASALRVAAGLSAVGPALLPRLNVAAPDAKRIDLLDAVILARKAAGLDENP